ncbi:MAG: amidase [Alphaproteobacteria bacterium]|nr:amidase [Alphaproteobacteria bacterium]
MPASHTLAASPATCHWGVFSASLKPVLTVQSGDRVTLHCVSGAAEIIPKGDFIVLPEHREITAALTAPVGGGHILTGPVAIEGARPGDVLEVRIIDIKLRQDWGWNIIRPLAGTIPEDFPATRLLNIPLDRERMLAKLPWGVDLPLAPFFGVIGVAPPAAWGTISTIQPRAHGGNLDNKELVAGTTLYLPVHAPGALFSAGDGHALQGDGEVCTTAIETALSGTFELHLRRGAAIDLPRAETPTHYITMAMDPDLDVCAKTALRQMISLIQEKANLSREDAYTLCSIAADMRVTQTVNQHKGIHFMLAKKALHG